MHKGTTTTTGDKKMTDVIEINEECQFLKDLETAPNFGGTVRGM